MSRVWMKEKIMKRKQKKQEVLTDIRGREEEEEQRKERTQRQEVNRKI